MGAPWPSLHAAHAVHSHLSVLVQGNMPDQDRAPRRFCRGPRLCRTTTSTPPPRSVRPSMRWDVTCKPSAQTRSKHTAAALTQTAAESREKGLRRQPGQPAMVGSAPKSVAAARTGAVGCPHRPPRRRPTRATAAALLQRIDPRREQSGRRADACSRGSASVGGVLDRRPTRNAASPLASRADAWSFPRLEPKASST